jgi:hypothetical protein
MFEEIYRDSKLLKDKRFVLEQMYQRRTSFEPTWQLLSRYIVPYRGRFHERGGSIDGERRDRYLIDPYPMDAAGKCAAGLQSGLTSPSRPWFELSLADQEKAEYHPVRQWLDDVRDVMMAVYARGNTYAMLYDIEAELCQFGTAAALMMQDYDTALWHRSYTCGEYAGGVDARGRLYSFGRRFELTAPQMVAEFGIDNVSVAVKTAYNNNDHTQRFEVEMLIVKNNEYKPDQLKPGNFPWKSFYWERGNQQQFLRISGYKEQPFIMPRWTKVGNCEYGYGPGHNALGNCMQLQRIEKAKLRCMDNEADPAMMFPASLKKVNRQPGANNFIPDGTQMNAYPMIPPGAKRYEGMIALSNDKRQQISATFYNDLMVMLTQAQNNPQMTAKEVAERHEEKILMLGPVLEQFHNEVLDPLTLRTFGLCMRNELFPPMPEEITADELKVNFVSLLAQAQKMVSLPSVQNVLGMVGNVAGIYPEAADIINIDNVIREVGVISGTPEKIMRSEDEVQQLREQRQQAQEAQMQQAQMAQGAEAAKTGAEAARLLSEVPANTDNALDDMLSRMGMS